MRKTHDYTYHYRGVWRDGGCCRIAVYAPEAWEADRRPVIVATELDDNAGSSVTNMAEYLAAEIVVRHFSHLLDAPAGAGQPVVWREQYPPGRGVPGEYDRVTFAPWRSRAAWLGGIPSGGRSAPPTGRGSTARGWWRCSGHSRRAPGSGDAAGGGIGGGGRAAHPPRVPFRRGRRRATLRVGHTAAMPTSGARARGE